MTQWYVKELSQLAGVSVQTLHHYEKIGLLIPSERTASGYRVYSEQDLLHLQQIIALKFFGFELKQIKALLADQNGAQKLFSKQAFLLEQKAHALLDASNTLKSIISEIDADKSIPWKTLIQLIEVYRMTQQLEHTWVKDIFTPEELKQYAEFEAEVLAKANADQKAEFEKRWATLVEAINHNLNNDPNSAIGVKLGQNCMELINSLYGKKYAHLRTKKFEEGFAKGKGLEEVRLTPESVVWLDKAIDAYWRSRIFKIFDQIGVQPNDTVVALWNEVLDDMVGEDKARRREIYDIAFAHSEVSDEAKAWLKTLL